MAEPVEEERYSQLELFHSAEARFAQMCLHYIPWEMEEKLMAAIRSELYFYLNVFGEVRLRTGKMPPPSKMMQDVLECCRYDDPDKFMTLPVTARKVMQPSDGSAPPVDRTGFPQWWKSHPKNWLASVHILDRLASGPAFNLSDYIINQAEAKMRQETKEEGASAQAFLDELGGILQRLERLKGGLWEVARGVVDLHNDAAGRFADTHLERQKAATVAQRAFEAATGRPEAPVPFQVPVPE